MAWRSTRHSALATKPENTSYVGSILGAYDQALITIDANPTFAYRDRARLTIGAGVQIEWAQAKLQFDETGSPTDIVGQFIGTDWAFGATAGIMIEPAAGTTIGLGYRSQLNATISMGTSSQTFGTRCPIRRRNGLGQSISGSRHS